MNLTTELVTFIVGIVSAGAAAWFGLWHMVDGRMKHEGASMKASLKEIDSRLDDMQDELQAQRLRVAEVYVPRHEIAEVRREIREVKSDVQAGMNEIKGDVKAINDRLDRVLTRTNIAL